MKKYYLAVTYDVCEHNDFFMDMNEYHLISLVILDNYAKYLAERDIAPIVRVFTSDTSDFIGTRLYKEYKFKEYECGCVD
ncbi:hypothetical protein CR203_20365 [Salipaludibacillus neizhouensis]|uniref:Uncharacterized protein n=1 Tax=Salipaludibacillus neizhouensis TaxID=885475 RepID=A0A3A9KDM2_9BACI|nr:hypothetical protein [Salipaludibacillus neizhouensis]RKL65555.1 hypothetical protein CR203_20365 [Salipaludibacillus neizhouensis]